MLFVELNDGTRENLTHITQIYVQDNTVIFERAKGSLDKICEHWDTAEQANNRLKELENSLLA